MTTQRIGGISLIIFVLAFVATFTLESLRVPLGFEDGDNPEQSVTFIRQHGRIYEASGIVQLLMTVALTIGSLAVAEVIRPSAPSLAVKSIAAFALFSAAGYFLNGALRLAAARPLLYIDDLRHEWGVTAYLIVQMVGVQGFAQAGLVNFGFWAIGISALNARIRLFPRVLSLLGIFPTFHLFAGLFGPFLGTVFDSLFIVYVLSIFGTVLWCLVLGILLVRWKLGP
ncbi:MAG: DUF4386 family protein [Caldilineaceae bacterium]